MGFSVSLNSLRRIRLCGRIDRKMSCSQTNYKLDEAQAICSELCSIKKAISTGEKERQDLIQVGPPPPLPTGVAHLTALLADSLLTSSG